MARRDRGLPTRLPSRRAAVAALPTRPATTGLAASVPRVSARAINSVSLPAHHAEVHTAARLVRLAAHPVALLSASTWFFIPPPPTHCRRRHHQHWRSHQPEPARRPEHHRRPLHSNAGGGQRNDQLPVHGAVRGHQALLVRPGWARVRLGAASADSLPFRLSLGRLPFTLPLRAFSQSAPTHPLGKSQVCRPGGRCAGDWHPDRVPRQLLPGPHLGPGGAPG